MSRWQFLIQQSRPSNCPRHKPGRLLKFFAAPGIQCSWAKSLPNLNQAAALPNLRAQRRLSHRMTINLLPKLNLLLKRKRLQQTRSRRPKLLAEKMARLKSRLRKVQKLIRLNQNRPSQTLPQNLRQRPLLKRRSRTPNLRRHRPNQKSPRVAVKRLYP